MFYFHCGQIIGAEKSVNLKWHFIIKHFAFGILSLPSINRSLDSIWYFDWFLFGLIILAHGNLDQSDNLCWKIIQNGISIQMSHTQLTFCILIPVWNFKDKGLTKNDEETVKMRRGAAIAQWIHLRLPSYYPGLNPKHTITISSIYGIGYCGKDENKQKLADSYKNS